MVIMCYLRRLMNEFGNDGATLFLCLAPRSYYAIFYALRKCAKQQRLNVHCQKTLVEFLQVGLVRGDSLPRAQ